MKNTFFLYTKSIVLSTIAISSILLFNGCKDNSLISSSSKNKPNPFALLATNIAGIDTTGVDAVVRLSAVKNYTKHFDATVSIMTAAASAAFTDSLGIATPTTVSVNGYSLTAPSNEVIWSNGDYHVYSTASAIWGVTGYDGGTFRDTVTFPSVLSITNHTPGDTVSQASGFTIMYSGYSGGTLMVFGRFDPGFTNLWKDSASAVNGQGMLGDYDTDNGSITISSSELSNFTTNRYITIEIIHFEYHTRLSSNGKIVGVISTYSDYFPFYLKS